MSTGAFFPYSPSFPGLQNMNDDISLSGRTAWERPPHSSQRRKHSSESPENLGFTADHGSVFSWPTSGCGYLSEERLCHSVLLPFPATSICASTRPNQTDYLISDLRGISHLNDQVLREVGAAFLVPPPRPCLPLSVEGLSHPESLCYQPPKGI